MGVTLHSKRYMLDIPYGGFARLRKRVADLYGGVIAQHYHELDDLILLLYSDARLEFLEQHGAKTAALEKTLDDAGRRVLDFLYAPDCDGSADPETCRILLEVVGDYRDHESYGYSGWKSPVRFADFVRLLKDCVSNGVPLEWY